MRSPRWCIVLTALTLALVVPLVQVVTVRADGPVVPLAPVAGLLPVTPPLPQLPSTPSVPSSTTVLAPSAPAAPPAEKSTLVPPVLGALPITPPVNPFPANPVTPPVIQLPPTSPVITPVLPPPPTTQAPPTSAVPLTSLVTSGAGAVTALIPAPVSPPVTAPAIDATLKPLEAPRLVPLIASATQSLPPVTSTLAPVSGAASGAITSVIGEAHDLPTLLTPILAGATQTAPSVISDATRTILAPESVLPERVLPSQTPPSQAVPSTIPQVGPPISAGPAETETMALRLVSHASSAAPLEAPILINPAPQSRTATPALRSVSASSVTLGTTAAPGMISLVMRASQQAPGSHPEASGGPVSAPTKSMSDASADAPAPLIQIGLDERPVADVSEQARSAASAVAEATVAAPLVVLPVDISPVAPLVSMSIASDMPLPILANDDALSARSVAPVAVVAAEPPATLAGRRSRSGSVGTESALIGRLGTGPQDEGVDSSANSQDTAAGGAAPALPAPVTPGSSSSFGPPLSPGGSVRALLHTLALLSVLAASWWLLLDSARCPRARVDAPLVPPA